MKVSADHLSHRWLWLLLGFALAAVLFGLWGILFAAPEAGVVPAASVPAPPVAAAPEPGASKTAAERFLGVVLARTEVDVGAELPGRLEQVFVRVGDRVAAGQRLAVMDTRDLRHQLAIERANLRAAEAEVHRQELEVERAKRELERRQALKDLLSREEVDAASFQSDTAIAAREAAEARAAESRERIAQLQATLERSEVRAPFAGTVALRFFDAGALVTSGTPVIRLISAGDLLVRFAAQPDLAADITLGRRVRVQVKELGQTFEGTVDHIAPQLDLASQMIFFEAHLDATAGDGSFPSGAAAEVELVTEVP